MRLSRINLQLVFSGIQPTGHPHIGNYLGALRNWVKIQSSQVPVLYSVVDLHALTGRTTTLCRDTVEMVKVLIACGIKPDNLFIQSKIPAHLELAWIFSTLTPVPRLFRMTQWKAKTITGDKESEEGLNLGLLSYPVLQTADILLYRATHVPVGDDQLQHLELARELAKRFNQRYARKNQLFIPPRGLTTNASRIMSLRDPQKKMSKSELDDRARISLIDSEAMIYKKIKAAVTDQEAFVSFDPEKRPGVSNLLQISAEFNECPIEEIVRECDGYKLSGFKEYVAKVVNQQLQPIRERYEELPAGKVEEELEWMSQALDKGTKRAQGLAAETMKQVYNVVGL